MRRIEIVIWEVGPDLSGNGLIRVVVDVCFNAEGTEFAEKEQRRPDTSGYMLSRLRQKERGATWWQGS